MDSSFRDYYVKMGLNIAYYRNLRGLTQDQLGDLIGIEQSHISRIERASLGISFDLLFKISNALDVEPYKLLQFRE